jgi:hypothetical protein
VAMETLLPFNFVIVFTSMYFRFRQVKQSK